jgi:hypothetical protein
MPHVCVLTVVLVGVVAPAEPAVEKGNPFRALVGVSTPFPEEITALWALTSRRQDEGVLDQLDEATRDARSAARLRDRADLALHATVGVDTTRRAQVERRLLAVVRDEALPLAHRVDLALLLSNLGELTPPAGLAVVQVLSAALDDKALLPRFVQLVDGILRARHALADADARSACGKVAERLCAALPGAESETMAARLLDTLARVLPQAGPEAADLRRTAATHLTRNFPRWLAEKYSTSIRQAAVRFVETLDKGDAEPTARRLIATLLEYLKRCPETQSDVYLAAEVATLARQLPDAEVARLGEELCPRIVAGLIEAEKPQTNTARISIPGLEEARTAGQSALLCRSLGAIVSRWHPRDAARVCEQANRLATEAAVRCSTARSSFAGVRAIQSLAALLAAVPPEVADPVRQSVRARLEAEFNRTEKVEKLATLGSYLAALNDGFPTDAGRKSCETVARDLQRRYHAAVSVIDRNEQLLAMAQTTYRISPPIGSAFSRLLHVSETARSSQSASDDLRALSVGLADLSRQVPPAEAAGLLLECLANWDRLPRTVDYTLDLPRALVDALESLDREQARDLHRSAAGLLERVVRNTAGNGLLDPAVVGLLARVACRLPAEERSQLVATVTGCLRRPKTGFSIGASVLAFQRCLSATEASELSTSLAQRLLASIIATSSDPRSNYINELTLEHKTLSGLARNLKPSLASELCAGAARRLLDKVEGEWRYSQFSSLSENLERMLLHTVGAEAAELRQRAARAFLDRPVLMDPSNHDAGRHLFAMLSPIDREERLSEVTAAFAFNPPAMLVPVLQGLRSLPEPPSAQLLVDMLKHPLCVGPNREAVLAVLGHRYGRTFADRWEFVTFATERKLGLDLRSPPKRQPARP